MFEASAILLNPSQRVFNCAAHVSVAHLVDWSQIVANRFNKFPAHGFGNSPGCKSYSKNLGVSKSDRFRFHVATSRAIKARATMVRPGAQIINRSDIMGLLSFMSGVHFPNSSGPRGLNRRHGAVFPSAFPPLCINLDGPDFAVRKCRY